MPAVRKTSSSKTKPLLTARALRARDSNRKAAPPPANESEVIVLSDSEDDTTLLARSQRRRRQTPVVPKAAAESSSAGRLRQEVEVLKKSPVVPKTPAESSSAVKLRQEIEALKKENTSLLKSLAKARKSDPPRAAIPGLSDLEDRVTCEICTTKMWSPFTLTECGHTFCEACLHAWFNTTYTRHIEQHPEFLAGPPIPSPAQVGVDRDDPQYRNVIDHYLRQWDRRVPKPTYTCPSCRVHIKTKPVEVYAMKDMVRLVAKMTSREGSPRANRSNRAVGSMFDGFFPARNIAYIY